MHNAVICHGVDWTARPLVFVLLLLFFYYYCIIFCERFVNPRLLTGSQFTVWSVCCGTVTNASNWIPSLKQKLILSVRLKNNVFMCRDSSISDTSRNIHLYAVSRISYFILLNLLACMGRLQWSSVPHLVKKHPLSPYECRRFIAVSTRARHRPLSSAILI